MEKNVCIVNFNTTELTRVAIQSLWKNTPDCKVTVFDNSDKEPFPSMEGVVVIDNTKGQIIDFEKFLDSYPDKQETSANNWGSAKHTKTIDTLFDYFPDGFVLMDSDILVKKDISVFFDESAGYIGKVFVDINSNHSCVPRLLPFLCWINVKMCQEHGIHYFDESRSWKLDSDTSKYHLYDTGASFLEDCISNNLSHKIIDISDYIIHLGSGSWRGKKSYEFWLESNKHLYMNKKEDKTEKYIVVIPYLAKAAQGNELELAIAGWRKHFKADYQLIVVGDWVDACDKADLFIECPRVKWPGQGNYWAHIDHINKFKKVRELFPDSEGFIYTCDDIYAVKDFTIEDVKKPKVRCREITGSFHNPNAWVKDNYRTKKCLERAGLPVMNWVCHLPVYYEWDKLQTIWERYDCENKSRVVEQLYFNTYQADTDYVVIEEEPNDWQYKIWDKKFNEEEVMDALEHKVWIANSVKGYNPRLEEILAGHYGL